MGVHTKHSAVLIENDGRGQFPARFARSRFQIVGNRAKQRHDVRHGEFGIIKRLDDGGVLQVHSNDDNRQYILL